MKVEQLEDITIDQQQAVFGAYDTLIAIVERALMVTIGLHNSVVEIKGESDKNVEMAADVLRSMLRLYETGDTVDEEVVHRLIDEPPKGAWRRSLRLWGM